MGYRLKSPEAFSLRHHYAMRAVHDFGVCFLEFPDRLSCTLFAREWTFFRWCLRKTPSHKFHAYELSHRPRTLYTGENNRGQHVLKISPNKTVEFFSSLPLPPS